MSTEKKNMQGPRGTQPNEFDQVMVLVNNVFRTGIDQDIATDYPLIFNRQNIQNMRIMLEDGKVVPHVAIVPREIIDQGCRFPAGLISVMATHPDHRRRGFATRIVEDALLKMNADGFDFGLLWTDVPDFYRHTGWEVVGTNCIEGYLADAHGCNKAGIVEWGGCRAALESLIAHVAQGAPRRLLQVFVPDWPDEVTALLEEKACRQRIPMEQGEGSGLKMLRIIRLKKLLQHLLPYMQRRLAEQSAELSIFVRETGERASFHARSGHVSIGEAKASTELELTFRQTANLIFGPGKPSHVFSLPGEMGEAMDRLFPFLFHVWMIDYV